MTIAQDKPPRESACVCVGVRSNPNTDRKRHTVCACVCRCVRRRQKEEKKNGRRRSKVKKKEGSTLASVLEASFNTCHTGGGFRWPLTIYGRCCQLAGTILERVGEEAGPVLTHVPKAPVYSCFYAAASVASCGATFLVAGSRGGTTLLPSPATVRGGRKRAHGFLVEDFLFLLLGGCLPTF